MKTLGDALMSVARRMPDAPALSFEDRHYTYAQLDQRINQFAHRLTALGVRKGDRVLVLSGNHDGFILSFWALMKLGAICVPGNPASAPAEISYLLKDAGASLVLVEQALAGAVEEAKAFAAADTEQSVSISLTHDDPAGLFALSAKDPTAAPAQPVSTDDDAVIMYTSGTTGFPKGALFDHDSAVNVVFNNILAMGFTEREVFIQVAPLYHSASMTLVMMTCGVIGGRMVLLPHFDPEDVLDALEREKGTYFFGVPAMYQIMLESQTLPHRDLSAWRKGMFGAAPMPESTVRRLIDLLPTVELTQMFGQTEGGPGGAYMTHDDIVARPAATSRRPMPQTEIRIVDANGDVVPIGETGEVIILSETRMKEYWRKPQATAETIRDGWIHTGDLAIRESDGYFTIVDRLKDMIISGGRNIYSVEVENALAAHPSIAEVAVVSRPSEVYGESVVAVATLKPGRSLTYDEMVQFAAPRLSKYKIPRELVISEIPRNPAGKIRKNVLRDRIRREDS